jgi:hypothetical protein
MARVKDPAVVKDELQNLLGGLAHKTCRKKHLNHRHGNDIGIAVSRLKGDPIVALFGTASAFFEHPKTSEQRHFPARTPDAARALATDN